MAEYLEDIIRIKTVTKKDTTKNNAKKKRKAKMTTHIFASAEDVQRALATVNALLKEYDEPKKKKKKKAKKEKDKKTKKSSKAYIFADIDSFDFDKKDKKKSKKEKSKKEKKKGSKKSKEKEKNDRIIIFDEIRNNKENQDAMRMHYRKERKENRKTFSKKIEDVEYAQMYLFEQIKAKKHIFNIKPVNIKQKEVYDDIMAVKNRKRAFRSFKENGILDFVMEIFQTSIPAIRVITGAICKIITMFLNNEDVQDKISGKTLSRLASVYDFAVAV